MAAILKVWCQIVNPTPSIDAYLVFTYAKNNSAKFRPDPIWNDGVLGFLRGRPDRNKKNNNNKHSKMSSNMKSVAERFFDIFTTENGSEKLTNSTTPLLFSV